MNICVVRLGIFEIVSLTCDLVQRVINIVNTGFSFAFATHEAFLWILEDVIWQ